LKFYGSSLTAQRGFSPDLIAQSELASDLTPPNHFLLSTSTLATLKYQMLGSAMFKQA
jgi:hypothetical protein